jgi:2-phospho-L-lactate transferase/gluconeogenesis factor (CofD/UPF0052 family)
MFAYFATKCVQLRSQDRLRESLSQTNPDLGKVLDQVIAAWHTLMMLLGVTSDNVDARSMIDKPLDYCTRLQQELVEYARQRVLRIVACKQESCFAAQQSCEWIDGGIRNKLLQLE